ERLLPRHRREFALALGADAAQRRCQAPRRVHELMVAVDLGAGKAGGERIGVIALDTDYAATLDVGEHGAHVGAIVGANDANGLQAGPPWRTWGEDGRGALCDRESAAGSPIGEAAEVVGVTSGRILNGAATASI